MSYLRENAWPQYGQLNFRLLSPLPLPLTFLPFFVGVDDLLLFCGGVGISCSCCCLLMVSALGGRPTFLGLLLPGVATTAVAAFEPLAGEALVGLALLPLVVLAIVSNLVRKSELSARRKR
jgi:hypothetical protein